MRHEHFKSIDFGALRSLQSHSGTSVTSSPRGHEGGLPKYGPTWTNITPGISAKTGSTTTFQHAGIKNNDAQSTSSAAISATRDYDAWGNVIASTGTFKAPFGYGGKFGYQEDADSGLKLLGHRYYDPNAGRFLTRDRIKDGRNWSEYAHNNPLQKVDPRGTRAVGLTVGAGGIIPLLAGSVSATIGVDLDTGHLGVQGTVGAGFGGGLSGGVNAGGSYDSSTCFDGNGPSQAGKVSTDQTATGISTPIGSGELLNTVKKSKLVGGNVTFGIGGNHGEGGGAYHERRGSWTYDLTQGLIDDLSAFGPLWDEFKKVFTPPPPPIFGSN